MKSQPFPANLIRIGEELYAHHPKKITIMIFLTVTGILKRTSMALKIKKVARRALMKNNGCCSKLISNTR
jgi:hypothetical protein